MVEADPSNQLPSIWVDSVSSIVPAARHDMRLRCGSGSVELSLPHMRQLFSHRLSSVPHEPAAIWNDRVRGEGENGITVNSELLMVGNGDDTRRKEGGRMILRCPRVGDEKARREWEGKANEGSVNQQEPRSSRAPSWRFHARLPRATNSPLHRRCV